MMKEEVKAEKDKSGRYVCVTGLEPLKAIHRHLKMSRGLEGSTFFYTLWEEGKSWMIAQ